MNALALRAVGGVSLSVFLFSFSIFATEPTLPLEDIKPDKSKENCLDALTPEQLALNSAVRMGAFFSAVRKNVKERDYVVDVAELALLAEEHMLMMGPPGNAKSMLAEFTLGQIIEGKNKTKSYYRIQMTPETTQSELVGPLDYKRLVDANVYKRLYDQGMLLSRNVFIDEIFDSRANSLRNILGLLAERMHAQGPEQTPGRIETVFAATNQYISEVYEKFGDDRPKAVLDRFAFSTFVPGDFEFVDSAVDLITGVKRNVASFPELSFDDLEAARTLVKRVEIPNYAAKFLALLRLKLKEETEALELKSIEQYVEKKKNGEKAAPPYRATKYQSPRTLAKAAAVLKAIVVQDWLKKGGKRALKANLEDIRKLELFFTLNGPSDGYIDSMLSRTGNPFERAQLLAIKQEREIFRRYYDTILKEMNGSIYRYALADLQSEIESSFSEGDKMRLVKKMMEQIIEVREKIVLNPRQVDLTGEQIGFEQVAEFLDSGLKQILGDRYDAIVIATLRDIDERKRLAAEEATRREQERLAEERQKELVRIQAEREAERLRLIAQERAQKLKARLGGVTPRSSGTLSISQAIANVPMDFSPSGKKGMLISGTSYWMIENEKHSVLAAKSPDLTSTLGGNMGAITDVLVPDDDHFILIADGRHAFVFQFSDHQMIYEFSLGAGNADGIQYAMTVDRKYLIIARKKMGEIVLMDWKTGRQGRHRFDTFASETSAGDQKVFNGSLSAMTSANDTLYGTEDRIVVTSNGMRGIFTLDLKKRTWKMVGQYQTPQDNAFAAFGFSEQQNAVYGWNAAGGTRIVKVNLATGERSYQENSAVHTKASPFLNDEGTLAMTPTDRDLTTLEMSGSNHSGIRNTFGSSTLIGLVKRYGSNGVAYLEYNPSISCGWKLMFVKFNDDPPVGP